MECSVANIGDQFLWSATNMGVTSALMLPITQEMAQEETKQVGVTPQSEPKVDPNMDTHLELLGFSEVKILWLCLLNRDITKRATRSSNIGLSLRESVREATVA